MEASIFASTPFSPYTLLDVMMTPLLMCCCVQGESTRFNINPLLDSNIRALISQVYVEGMMAGIMSRTMNSKTHGPTISVQRITAE